MLRYVYAGLVDYQSCQEKKNFFSLKNFLRQVIYNNELIICKIFFSAAYFQGLYIRYRDVSANSQQYNILTVLNPSIESHVVGNLKEYTKYEFFLAPFFQTLEGQPSNSKIVQTYEDGKLSNNKWGSVEWYLGLEGLLWVFKGESININE